MGGKAKQIEYNCANCGKLDSKPEYQYKRTKTHFCSNACKIIAQQTGKLKTTKDAEVRTFKCDHCAIEYTRTAKTGHFNKPYKHRFCSPACKILWQKVDPSRGANWKGGCTVIHTCKHCNKEFEIQRSQRMHDGRKDIFCSIQCKKDYYVKDKNHNYTKITKQCEVCGTNITRFASYFDKYNTVTCSAQCSGKILSGVNSPNWKGGVTPLHTAIRESALNEKWKIDIFIQKGKRCILCNSNKKVQIHHIEPFAKICRDNAITDIRDINDCESLWDKDNGDPLCYKCHAEFHSIYGSHKCTKEQYFSWKESKNLLQTLLLTQEAL